MADTDDIQIKISAVADGAQKVFKDTADAAQGAVDKITSGFEGLTKPFELVRTHLAGITAILAGGTAFTGAIDATKEWSGEQVSLAKQLQISTEKAAAYQIALRQSGLDGGVLVSASDKLTKQLVKNEDAFSKIGIATRNANGSYRSTGEMLPEVIAHLQGLHNVTEQNSEGMALFGRSWTEVRGILKLSKEQLAEAAEKARDLNLVVDPAAIRQYKSAMADVHLVMTSLNVQVGSAVMPTLTKLASWMGGEGKTASDGIKTAIDAVGEAFLHVYYGAQVAMTKLGGWAAAAGALLSGNLAGARDVLAGLDDEVDALADRWGKAVEKFKMPAKATGGLGDEGEHVDLTKEPKEKKDPSRAPQWEAELAEQKLALQEIAAENGFFYEMSKAQEREFWQDKLALTVAGTAENVAVRKKSAELGLAIQKDAFDVELQGLKTQADAFKNNMTARIAIAEQEATLIGQKYGTESKEYLAVQGEITKLQREAAAQALQIEEAKQASLRQVRLSEIDLAQEIANERYALGLINEAQLLQLERQFEDQRTQIAVSAQQARIAAIENDPDHSPVALQKEKDQLLAIEQQHALAVQKINGKIAVEAQSTFKTMSDSISSAFANMFESLLTRQQSFSQASIALGNAVLSAAIKAVLDEKAVKEAVWNGLSAVYEVLAGTKRATDAASSTDAIVTKKVEAVSIINAEAGEAAAGAAASVAGIPIVGPALAAAAFVDTMAMVLGGALPLASAAGGYDIPRSINPIVQTHAREMILPAELADRVRAVTPGGGNSGGGNGTTINMHFNGPTTPREHEKWIAEHLAGAMVISNRNFRTRAR